MTESMIRTTDDVNPRTPREDTIIYELHVRGFTVDPSSGVRHPGTFAGLVEKIPYLKELGVTAVELLPVDEFDENDCPFVNPLTGERLRNFWGYNTDRLRRAQGGLRQQPGGHPAPWAEFREMVDAFHDAGIEVILDVVFNHTAEGGEGGPTYSFRGLDNSLYYMLDEQGRYLNFTGCGNTVNSNHPVVRKFLLTCLRNWVAEAGVDGFRFDLASVLGRDRRGNVLVEPPVIEHDLRGRAAGRHQADRRALGRRRALPGRAPSPAARRWSDWNGRYRDDVRRFWRGDPGMTSAPGHAALRQRRPLPRPRPAPLDQLHHLPRRLHARRPRLLQPQAQRGQRRGQPRRQRRQLELELRRRGADRRSRRSWRSARRQVRNLMATLMISQGVPMILGGDEFLRTQHGNNNAWCQDNDDQLGRLDAGRGATPTSSGSSGMMIALRKRHPVLRRRTFFRGGDGDLPPDIVWHGVEPCRPDFSRTAARSPSPSTAAASTAPAWSTAISTSR